MVEGRLFSILSPARTSQKAVTPGSVKVLMLVEAGIVAFLSYWVLSEYMYNAYLRSYADQVLISHVTTYTALLGLGIGLAGSAAAAALYKSLRDAKRRLETMTVPRIRGAVGKVLTSLPISDANSSSLGARVSLPQQASSESAPTPAAASVVEPEESKKA